jgi:hypothetical protein
MIPSPFGCNVTVADEVIFNKMMLDSSSLSFLFRLANFLVPLDISDMIYGR